MGYEIKKNETFNDCCLQRGMYPDGEAASLMNCFDNYNNEDIDVAIELAFAILDIVEELDTVIYLFKGVPYLTAGYMNYIEMEYDRNIPQAFTPDILFLLEALWQQGYDDDTTSIIIDKIDEDYTGLPRIRDFVSAIIRNGRLERYLDLPSEEFHQKAIELSSIHLPDWYVGKLLLEEM